MAGRWSARSRGQAALTPAQAGLTGSAGPPEVYHSCDMPANTLYLISAATALVLMTFVVGMLMLRCRISEMRAKRIHPQAVSTSTLAASRYENVQAADNFRNLFETPVLFYALVAIAIGVGQAPGWLAAGAWLYVILRLVHTVIHCSYNNVMHRLAAFMSSFGLLVGLWIFYLVGLAGARAA